MTASGRLRRFAEEQPTAASPRGTLDPRCCGDPHPRGRSSAGHMLTLPVGVDGGATGSHVVRMRRSIRSANPLVPAAERSRRPAFAITEFATDSPLEQAGFELSVPAAVSFVKTRYHPVAREYRRRPLYPARREKIAPSWQGLSLAPSGGPVTRRG